jgi:Flp pilus assembly protein TadG
MRERGDFGLRTSDFGLRRRSGSPSVLRRPYIRNPKSEVRKRGRRGAALVEFALVVPLLMLLLLGVMEFGMIMHDYLTLAHSVREGVRTAAIGNTTAQIRQQVQRSSLPALQDSMIHVRYQDKKGDWVEVTGSPAGAAVPSDAHFAEVSIVGYPHKMVTGSFFAWLPGVENNTMQLHSKMVMRRE